MMSDAFFALVFLTVGFVTYHFLSHAGFPEQYFLKKWGQENGQVKWVYFQRALGVFVYGVLPLLWLFIQQADFGTYGIAFQNGKATLGWMALLSLAVVVMNYFATQSADIQAQYPQIRVAPPWRVSLLVGSAVTWVAYLLAYEFLFRGYLLFSCERAMGTQLAIAVNVSLYALVHVPKGWKETAGAVPLGVVLCLLTLQTGTIWVATGVHVVMALSNEWWALWFASRKAIA